MIPAATPADLIWCRERLPEVSRTFAACIGLLPGGLEWPVLIAYLLCRVADTIEDCPRLPPETKVALLATFANCLDDPEADLDEIAATFAEPADADERMTASAARVVACYRQLNQRQRDAIRPWVEEMCDGMAAFALAHPGAAPGQVDALDDLHDLDRYCYYVAGTVGHLLTELFQLHHHRVTPIHYRRLKKLATSFGLGLQLTNIIKDVADDRRRGWSFVPRALCQVFGTDPERFLDPERSEAAQAVMQELIAKAEHHLDDALAYCLTLPRSQYRMRIFCLTPLYFAVRTLRLAKHDPQLLDPDHKVKISRREVHRIIRTTAVVAPNNHLVRGYYRRLHRTDVDAAGS